MSHRSLSPYVIGSVYNGREDKPTPYKNDDESNDRRVFWSRSQHLVDFNDCDGSESVGLGACATVRLNVESAPIHQVHDSAGESIRQYCAGSTFFEGTQRFSVRCKSPLEAERVSLGCGNNTAIQAQQVTMECGGSFACHITRHSSEDPLPPTAIAASEAAPCLHPHDTTGGQACGQVSSVQWKLVERGHGSSSMWPAVHETGMSRCFRGRSDGA